MQTYETINGYPVEEFIKWYEEKYDTTITQDLTWEFSYEELEKLADEFVEEKE